MTMDYLHLLHQAFFGGLAAAGFGVLFNFGLRDLPWCFAGGFLALAVRTLGLDAHWSLEAASFAAAATLTTVIMLFLQTRLGTASGMVALAGCIPMVPGVFMTQSILGLFSLTSPQTTDMATQTALISVQYGIRVTLTVCAIGAGIAIPTHVIRHRDF